MELSALFIRVSKKNVNGKTYSYHKLVESYRNGNNVPTNRTILDIGHLDLDKTELKELAKRIEEIVYTKKQRLIDTPEHIEKLAQELSSKIIKKMLNKQEETNEEVTIDPSTVETSNVKTIGAEYVGHEIFKELELEKILKNLGFSKEDIDMTKLAIIGRLVNPASENATIKWAENYTGLDELLGLDFSKLNKNKVYEISDKLYRKRNEIEEELRKTEERLYSLEEKIVLFDLTNTYYEGVGADSDILKRGRSKEKRTDCKIVTLGLVLDSRGFVKRSEIYPGNISEPSTLIDVLNHLEKKEENSLVKSKKTLVMDAGILTESNISLIKEKGYNYIGVSRTNKVTREDCNTDDLIDIKEGVRAKLIENESENILYVESEGRKAKEKAMKNLFQERFEEGLKKLNDGLSKKGCTKNYEKVVEKIGRLKEKCSLVSSHYNICIEKEKANATKINWELKESLEKRFDGNYCLRTNLKDLSEKEILSIYVMLTKVESSFRFFKTDLGLRPMYHKKDKRIEGHLFITVLAFHLLKVVEMKLNKSGIYKSWKTIKEALHLQSRVTTSFKTKEGKILYIRNTTKPTEEQVEIYKALGLENKPLKSKKILI